MPRKPRAPAPPTAAEINADFDRLYAMMNCSEVASAARAIVKLWFGTEIIGPAGKDKAWELMRRLRLALEEHDAASSRV